tara:strand:- start:516 stop:845 length:330 start_codon:yes stop_codon:yes gene_type:complete
VDPYHRIAQGVIARALKDMCRSGAKNTTAPSDRDHRQSVLWLGSTRATLWFDFAELSQETVLRKTNWPEHAANLIKTQELTERQKQFLTSGIEYFEHLTARQHNLLLLR